MVAPEYASSHGHGFTVKGFRFVQMPPLPLDVAEVVQRQCHEAMIAAELRFVRPENLPKKRICPHVVSLVVARLGEVADCVEDIRMVGIESLPVMCLVTPN